MLKNWDGLTSVHVKAVEALCVPHPFVRGADMWIRPSRGGVYCCRHGLKESAALIDLLNWLLDPIPSHRPADMAGVRL